MNGKTTEVFAHKNGPRKTKIFVQTFPQTFAELKSKIKANIGIYFLHFHISNNMVYDVF